MKKCLCWLFLCCFPFFLSAAENEKPTLIESDFIYLHLVQSAFGKPAGFANTPDPDVHVAKDLIFLDLSKKKALLSVKVIEDNPAKTQALATLLTQAQECGQVTVYVRVFDFQGHEVKPGELPSDPEEAKTLFKTALQGNWYFTRITPGNPYNKFFVEFRTEVVQFFTDSMSNYIRCGNLPAEVAFAQLLQVNKVREFVKMGVTTEEVRIPTRRWRRILSPFSCCR